MIAGALLSGCPFPGLRPFEPENEELFFGREEHVDELLRRLRLRHVVAVIGTSGSGKSSLVRAGLIPRLYGGLMAGAGPVWQVALLRPGREPIAALATALDEAGILGDEGHAALRIPFARATLEQSPDGLRTLVEAPHAPESNVLIVVDQFEELFRYAETRGQAAADEAAAFVRLLLRATENPGGRIYVLLTMRADFVGDCARFRELPERLNDSLYLIPRLSREQMRRAIVGPLGVLRQPIAPRLVNELLNHVGDDPDQLPVLQHALMRTWKRWQEFGDPSEPMDLVDYDAVGGLQAALSRHGNQVYASLGPRKRACERLFKAITSARGVRRALTIEEAQAVTGASADDLIAVVDAFAAPECGFLMPLADGVIDLTHESVMRLWDTAAKWVAQEAASAQRYSRLIDRATTSDGKGPELLDGASLDAAKAWRDLEQPNAAWALRYGTAADWLAVTRLVDRSLDARELAAQRRTYRLVRAVSATIVGEATLFVVLGMAGVSRDLAAELLLLYSLLGLAAVGVGIALLGRRHAVVAGLAVIAFGALTFAAGTTRAVSVSAQNMTPATADDALYRAWVELLPPGGRAIVERGAIAKLHEAYNFAVAHQADARLFKNRPISKAEEARENALASAPFAPARSFVAFLAYFLHDTNGHVQFYHDQIEYAVAKVQIAALKHTGDGWRSMFVDSDFDQWGQYVKQAPDAARDGGRTERCWSHDGWCSERAAWAYYIEAFAHYQAAVDPDAKSADRRADLRAAREDLLTSLRIYPGCTWLYDKPGSPDRFLRELDARLGLPPPTRPIVCDPREEKHDPFKDYADPT